MEGTIRKSKIDALNSLSLETRRKEFFRCCASSKWVEAMMGRFPFSSIEELQSTALELWSQQPQSEWLLAFSAHPRIGDAAALKAKFSQPNSWEGDEQKGASTASEEVLRTFAKRNQDYVDKFGFIFLICATGKSAQEMLAALEARITNNTDEEV